jgi:hypothetical protein
LANGDLQISINLRLEADGYRPGNLKAGDLQRNSRETKLKHSQGTGQEQHERW